MEKDPKKIAAAVARTQSLSPERRSEIARNAALAKQGRLRVAVTKEGVIRIGESEFQTYVLDDETRVIARASFARAIGRTGKVKGGRDFDEQFQVPVFLSAENLRPFFPSDFEKNMQPVFFSYGGMNMIGYRAELLPDVCDIFADAEFERKLRPNQKHIAKACRLLSRGLTRVGIIGLVDEATGYQRIRAANALALILEQFIAKELQPWVHTFPESFYEELFRLRRIAFPSSSIKRPQYFGHLTNDIIYDRIAPGLKEELRNTVPKTTTGRRKHQFHRLLTPDMGHPKLREHLASVTTIMKLSSDYADFKSKLDRIHPRYGDTIPMDFGYEGL